ncbi:hypothetical protein [Streptomyces sp. NPDC001137]|uniref:hypothetical protein n=1 Tax=Streptomyces sp. NPDC001137 TaxID=3154378 RepID=UPI0033323D03
MKSSPLAAAVLAGAVLGLAAVTGCSAPTTNAGSLAATPSATAPAGCPTAASLRLPKDFPASLPMPDGALVTSVERRSGERLVVAMVVRSGFDRTLAFLQKQLPEAGYTLREGEVEEDDAESNFSSATFDGRWTLRKTSDCGGGVYLTYLTAPAT